MGEVEAEAEAELREKNAEAAQKKAEAAAARAKADRLNAIAGAAFKKLSDEKKKANEEAIKANLEVEKEERIVEAKKRDAAQAKKRADAAAAAAKAKRDVANDMLKLIAAAQCKKHAGCSHLEGYCCPTLDFNSMHLRSAKLAGPTLACCGAAEEIETAAVESAPTSDSTGFLASVFMAFAGGIAVGFSALKLSSTQKGNDAGYKHLAA